MTKPPLRGTAEVHAMAWPLPGVGRCTYPGADCAEPATRGRFYCATHAALIDARGRAIAAAGGPVDHRRDAA